MAFFRRQNIQDNVINTECQVERNIDNEFPALRQLRLVGALNLRLRQSLAGQLNRNRSLPLSSRSDGDRGNQWGLVAFAAFSDYAGEIGPR